MQGSADICSSDVGPLLSAVFIDEHVDVYTAYSNFGKRIRKFSDVAALRHYADETLGVENGFLYLALRYPDSGPRVQVKKIALDPKKCDGHRFRYCVEGWGLIYIQCDAQRPPLLTCRISANTRKRALAWRSTYEELGNPDEWNWTAVERHTRRLIRLLRKLGARPSGR